MQELNVVGLDLAKNVFQVHIADRQGKKVGARRLKRAEMKAYFAQLPKSVVGMEACGGAHYWGREIKALGHEVKLMAPQYVKAYVQREKSDTRDAAGISEAAGRASVPAVALRSLESQQLQGLHRVRELWMKQKVATANQIRGLLGEYGEVFSQGLKALRVQAREWLGRAGVEYAVLKGLIEALLEALKGLEERISALEAQLLALHRANAASGLIEAIPGVGLLSATAAVAAFGRCEGFAQARQFACALGLTPREHSSGQKQQRLGISKRGNRYVRKLFIHGARSVLKARINNPAHAEDWVVRLAKRRGHNIAVVALAAKNARCIWAMLRTGEVYRAAPRAAAGAAGA
jgi:transposase